MAKTSATHSNNATVLQVYSTGRGKVKFSPPAFRPTGAIPADQPHNPSGAAYLTFFICLPRPSSAAFTGTATGAVFRLASAKLCQNNTIGLATNTDE